MDCMLAPRDGGNTTAAGAGWAEVLVTVAVELEESGREGVGRFDEARGEEERDAADGLARRFKDLSLLNAGLGGARESGRWSVCTTV